MCWDDPTIIACKDNLRVIMRRSCPVVVASRGGRSGTAWAKREMQLGEGRQIREIGLDVDIVEKCLRAVTALASYHYREKIIGKEGLAKMAMSSPQSTGDFQDSILSYFLRLLLQLLLSQDFRMELAGSSADCLLPLVLCEHDQYQKMVQEFLDRQQSPAIMSRLASAFSALTSGNKLSSSLDRPNRFKFRKNLQIFLTEVSGFLSII
ncbi:hypothetical protein ZIOFF_065680 [Zingiber officinale]|uniref:Uncharacterized protein n=1 Tax=Zingiber officinale TaxID=94328 RepID=A0A8J5EXE2_ZINOF|nr:hypothetical protein ZIOFF_065680 [Zingiber officinale]